MKGLGFHAYVHHDVVRKINQQDLARRMAMAGTDVPGAVADPRLSRRARLKARLGTVAAARPRPWLRHWSRGRSDMSA